MTRLPAENRDVSGIDYCPEFPKYKVGPLCAAPGCSRIADHAHHIWRRSFLTGDYGWVKLGWDGTIVQNLAGLCWQHHQLITENKAEISWTGMRFMWRQAGDLSDGYWLEPQPRIWNATSHVTELTEEDDHDHGPGSVEKCPTCHRAVKRDKVDKKAEKRPRKNWTITVPVDERENGAQVLDTLVEEVAKVFGHDETQAVKYFTVCQALALVLQDYAGS